MGSARSKVTVVLWVAVAAIWLLPVVAGVIPPWFVLRMIGTGAAVLLSLIVLHELGHALVGRLLGYRIFEISVGTGPPLVATVVGRTRVSLSMIPAGGHTLLAPRSDRLVQAREVFVSIAGPAVNVVVLAVVFGSDMPEPWRSAVIWLSAALAIENLWPRRVTGPLGVVFSDGLRAAHALDADDAAVRSLLASRYLGESYVSHAKHDHADAIVWDQRGLADFPGNPSFEGDIATSQIMLGEYGPARERLLGLVDRPDLEDAQRALYRNNLAWADLMLDDPELVPEALSLSKAALDVLPTIPAVKGTRGFALIMGGGIDEGIVLCGEAQRGNRGRDERASNACCLAIGAARQGRIGVAERHLRNAIRLAPENALIDRAGDELRRARSRSEGVTT